MDINEAQRKAIQLARLAASAPSSEEGRSAAVKAWQLVFEHGLVVMKPGDVVQMPAPASAPKVATAPEGSFDPRRIGETAHVVADTVVSGLGAAGKIANALSGFKRAAGPRRRSG